MFRLKSFRWITAFMLIFTALVGSAILAQDNAPVSFELVGNVEAMNASSIAVHGHIIDITEAEISVTLEIGLAVRVHGVALPDGRIEASEVDAAENDDILPGEVEVIGVWPAEVGDKVAIGGVIFNLMNAEVDSRIVAGDQVVVHATLSPEGIWVIREVRLFEGDDNGDDNSNDNGNTNDNGNDNADDNSNDNTTDNSNDNSNGGATDEFELTGTLENIGNGFIVVSGATIDTTSAEIHGNLIVGALVKVHVAVIDGRLMAREVELVSQDNSGDNDNTDDNSNDNSSGDDNQNDNSDDNGNDNEDSGLPTIPGDCVASMPAGWTTYTIQSGDTLSSIASRAGTNVGNLMQVNCIANPSMIVAGTNIFVPRTPDPVGNSNDNNDDNANNDNDNGDDNGNDNRDDNDNSDDNNDDNGNDNRDDNSNDNGNDNADDHGGGNDNDDDNGGGNDNNGGSNDNDDDNGDDD